MWELQLRKVWKLPKTAQKSPIVQFTKVFCISYKLLHMGLHFLPDKRLGASSITLVFLQNALA
jgi:hypothetical protein